MALGTVKASGGLQTQLVSGRSSEITSQAISGLGDAVNRLAQTGLGYLNSRTDIERIYDQRAQQSKGLELDTQFLQYQQDRAKEFTEFSRERSATPGGMTKDYDTYLAAKEDEFLKTVPPRFQEAMKAKLAQDRAIRVGSAFTSELTLLDTTDTNNLNKGLNTLGSGLKGGSLSLEDAQASWEEIVFKSGLPEADKQTFIDSGKAKLQGLEFGTIVEQGALGYGAVSDGSTGDDVVAAGLLPQERAVLNAISANEASRYDVWNGGSTFEGYEDHPAATSKAPGESTAAGRYQFVLGTWRAASASYEQTYGVKVPNFSPEWQDRVALHWAEVQFNKHYNNASFREILASGDPQQLLLLRDVLGKPRSSDPNDLEWEGLGHMTDAQFIEVMTGQKGIAGGGTGPATGPNIWTDERFSGLSIDQKLGFANAAAAAAEQQKQAMSTEIKMQRESFLDQAYNAGYANQPGMLEALQNSSNWDAEAQAKYNSGQEVYRANEKNVSTVAGDLAAGTPLSTNKREAFGKWFGEDSFAGIMTGDQKAYDKMRWAVGQAKIFPEGSVDAFRSALGDPNTKAGALEFLGMAHAGNSSILKRSGFSDDDIAMVQLYTNLAGRTGSQEAAMKDYEKATNAQLLLGKSPTVISKEAGELFTETYANAADLVDNFDGWLSARPDATLNPSTEGMLMLDAKGAYQDGYLLTGSAEGADAYMQAFLKNTWGTTQTRSLYFEKFGDSPTGTTVLKPVLMKYPPEKYFQDIDGSSGFVYDELAKFALMNGAQQHNAVLLSDNTTEQEIKEGKLPTYVVIGRDEFGGALVLPGRFGGESLGKIGETSVSEGSLFKNAIEGVTRFSVEAEKIQSKIVAAEKMGEAPAVVEDLRKQLVKMEQYTQAAKLAAVENGHLDTNMPQTVDDPKLDELANTVAETFFSDSTAMRKVASLAVTFKNMSPEEARRQALAQIFTRDYKLTPEVGFALMEKVLGGN